MALLGRGPGEPALGPRLVCSNSSLPGACSCVAPDQWRGSRFVVLWYPGQQSSRDACVLSLSPAVSHLTRLRLMASQASVLSLAASKCLLLPDPVTAVSPALVPVRNSWNAGGCRSRYSRPSVSWTQARACSNATSGRCSCPTLVPLQKAKDRNGPSAQGFSCSTAQNTSQLPIPSAASPPPLSHLP